MLCSPEVVLRTETNGGCLHIGPQKPRWFRATNADNPGIILVLRAVGLITFCRYPGHVAMGTIEYGQYTQFDNVVFYSTQTVCGGTPAVEGAAISIVPCSTEVGPKPGSSFDFVPSVRIQSISMCIQSISMCIQSISMCI